MGVRGSDQRSLKRAALCAWLPRDASKAPTSEVAEAIATVEARKSTIMQRAKVIAKQSKQSPPKRRKKKERKEYIARGEGRDIFTKGYRLKGSGWAGKGQR
jgi:hypothetical protein